MSTSQPPAAAPEAAQSSRVSRLVITCQSNRNNAPVAHLQRPPPTPAMPRPPVCSNLQSICPVPHPPLLPTFPSLLNPSPQPNLPTVLQPDPTLLPAAQLTDLSEAAPDRLLHGLVLRCQRERKSERESKRTHLQRFKPSSRAVQGRSRGGLKQFKGGSERRETSQASDLTRPRLPRRGRRRPGRWRKEP